MSLFWERFCQQAAQTPRATALLSTGRAPGEPVNLRQSHSLSYGELWQQASQLAQNLVARGLRPGDLVALEAPRSVAFVVALLATWAARGHWLPLHGLPPARRETLLQLCQPSGTRKTRIWHCHGDAPAPLAQASPPLSPGQPQDLAYLIFTSGSSGQPKGVRVPQAGLVPMLEAQIQALELGPGMRSLWVLSPHFDASVSDLGTALLSGATLVIDPEPLQDLQTLYQLLHTLQINYLDLPPALLASLDPAQVPPSLTRLLLGGEAPPVQAVRSWSQRLRLFNAYGPTEASVCTSLCRCGPDWQEPLLGQPLPGVSYRLVTGELWIQSPGLAQDYLAQAALTASRFVLDAGQRWYRTGDRVRRNARGEYVFVGRLDRQFKHHGQLICPEEIEAALQPWVKQVAVVKHLKGQLLAFFEPLENPATDGFPHLPDQLPAQLQDRLAASLPASLQPDRLIALQHWPRSASGKICLQSLSQLDLTALRAETPPFCPANALEAQLAQIWQQVLACPHLPAEPHFFELGGHSLQVLNAVALAADQGLLLSPEAFYTHPQLRELVGQISQTRQIRQVRQPSPGQGLSSAQICQQLPAPAPISPASVTAQAPQAQKLHTGLQTQQPAELLLTGATGYLGSRLLAEILVQTRWRCHCLVRAQSVAAGRQRLEQALRRWLPEPGKYAGRLELLPLGLEQMTQALDSPALQAHLQRCQAIVHCAAQVDLVRDLETLLPVNVQAVAALYALGLPLHHVSTLSVLAGARPQPALALESDRLESPVSVYGGYAQSKWAAERWLHRQQDLYPGAGPPVWIYRPGLIGPAQASTGPLLTGPAPGRDWLQACLQGLQELGCLPAWDEISSQNTHPLALDLIPVDWVARSLLQLMQGPAGVFHLANPRPLLLGELWHWAQQHWQLAVLPAREWLQQARQARAQAPQRFSSSALLALWQACDPSGQSPESQWQALSLFQATGLQLASAQTLARLQAAGIQDPAPGPDLLAATYQPMPAQALTEVICP